MHSPEHLDGREVIVVLSGFITSFINSYVTAVEQSIAIIHKTEFPEKSRRRAKCFHFSG